MLQESESSTMFVFNVLSLRLLKSTALTSPVPGLNVNAVAVLLIRGVSSMFAADTNNG